MAESVINIAPAGALKNGQRVFSFDFGNGRWDLAIAKISGMFYVFGSYWNGTTQGAWGQVSKQVISGTWNEAVFQPYKTELLKYAQDNTYNPTATYPTDLVSEIGLYIDSKAVITTSPATVKTTEDKIAEILTGSTVTDPTAADTKAWYQKPITYILGVIVLGAIGFFAFKK
jgi:hypothetical protein